MLFASCKPDSVLAIIYLALPLLTGSSVGAPSYLARNKPIDMNGPAQLAPKRVYQNIRLATEPGR